jgi:hypothetical protein
MTLNTGKLFYSLGGPGSALTDAFDNVFAPTNDALDKAAITDSAFPNVLRYHGE